MATILDLLAEYGLLFYGLLFLYTVAKSGSLPLFAGYAAHLGALDVALVSAATFSGGYLGDEVRFQLARRHGAAWLARRPRFSAAVARATGLLERHGRLYLFAYRYPKGLRTVGAFPVGLTTMPWSTFTGLNAASAGLWTLVMVGLGYGFGPWIDRMVERGFAFVSVALLALFVGTTVVLWRRHRPAG
jgi:membrane-associated protein